MSAEVVFRTAKEVTETASTTIQKAQQDGNTVTTCSIVDAAKVNDLLDTLLGQLSSNFYGPNLVRADAQTQAVKKDQLDVAFKLVKALEDLNSAMQKQALSTEVEGDKGGGRSIRGSANQIATIQSIVQQQTKDQFRDLNICNERMKEQLEKYEGRIKTLESELAENKTKTKKPEPSREQASRNRQELEAKIRRDVNVSNDTLKKEIETRLCQLDSKVINLSQLDAKVTGLDNRLTEVDITLMEDRRCFNSIARSAKATNKDDITKALRDSLSNIESGLRGKDDEISALQLTVSKLESEVHELGAELTGIGRKGDRNRRRQDIDYGYLVSQITSLSIDVENVRDQIRHFRATRNPPVRQ